MVLEKVTNVKKLKYILILHQKKKRDQLKFTIKIRDILEILKIITYRNLKTKGWLKI